MEAVKLCIPTALTTPSSSTCFDEEVSVSSTRMQAKHTITSITLTPRMRHFDGCMWFSSQRCYPLKYICFLSTQILCLSWTTTHGRNCRVSRGLRTIPVSFWRYHKLFFCQLSKVNKSWLLKSLPEFGSGSNFRIRVFIFTHKNAIFSPKSYYPNSDPKSGNQGS